MTEESGHELQTGYAVYLGEFIRCREKKMKKASRRRYQFASSQQTHVIAIYS